MFTLVVLLAWFALGVALGMKLRGAIGNLIAFGVGPATIVAAFLAPSMSGVPVYAAQLFLAAGLIEFVGVAAGKLFKEVREGRRNKRTHGTA